MKKIFVLIGTTGVGKTFYSKLLDEKHNIMRIKALTTRPERPTHPNEYIHVSKEVFEEEIASDNMLEYTIFDEHYYGKRKDDVFSAAHDSHAVLEMTADRLAELKSQVPNAVAIHLSTEEPIIANMISRVKDRNWSDEKINQRIEVLKSDMIEIDTIRSKGLIDHEIVTIEGDRDATINKILDIINSY